MKKNNIISFSNLLREEGMSVSIRTTKTANEVWNIVKYTTELTELKSALKSVYIKDIEDIPTFNNVFEEVFIKKHKNINQQTNNSEFQNESIHPEDIIPNNLDKNKQTLEYMMSNINMLEKNRTHPKENEIRNMDINKLKPFDENILKICRKLGLKIANQRNNREKKAENKNIAMRKTIRKNIKNGGKLIELAYSKPSLHKSKHIFLNDVSGSCDWISTWFFTILYGCYNSFDKIKIYDFDNKIIEITDALQEDNYQSAYEKVALQHIQNIMIHGKSDMTTSFNEFLKKAPINNKTDVIILSDCRDWTGKKKDNLFESAKVLKKIITKSHNVMILNPEPKNQWTGESICVSDYQTVGANIYEIKTLNNLTNLITKL